MDGVKTEGSPVEIGPAFMASAESAEHLDDHFSDDEPENEVEALQHLPPEERRKALRRLRNRESARRVRARRLAEVSQMGTTMQGLQDENTALKAHVNKLQSHIQSMTLKVYEVTGKYESAVAETAQLRAELLRIRRLSAPGDSSFMAPSASGAPAAAAAAAAANGPNSAPLYQLSPFISPIELAAGGGQSDLTPGLAQLRSSSPMDLQQQRHALEEVVMLLREHKRRHQGPGQDRSGGSEIGSCGAGGNNVTTTQSPTSDVPLAGAGPPVSGLAASGLGTNNSSTNGMSYNVGNLSRFNMGGDGTGASSLGGLRGCQSDILTGSIQQSAPHLPMLLQTNSRLPYGDHMGMCSSAVMANMHNMCQAQPLPLAHAPPPPRQMLGDPGPAPSLSLPLPTQQQQHLQQHLQQQQLQLPQQLQTRGQSHSHPLELLQLPYHQQFSLLNQQQQMQANGQQAAGSSAQYGTMSSLSLSAPFYSAVSAMPHGGGGAGCGGGLQMAAGHNSGPTALGSGIGGLGSNLPSAAQGLGGGLGNNHRSASYALDRGACAAGAHNVAAIHSTWHGNAGAAGVAALRPEDLSEDILMSLDEYVPQDL